MTMEMSSSLFPPLSIRHSDFSFSYHLAFGFKLWWRSCIDIAMAVGAKLCWTSRDLLFNEYVQKHKFLKQAKELVVSYCKLGSFKGRVEDTSFPFFFFFVIALSVSSLSCYLWTFISFINKFPILASFEFVLSVYWVLYPSEQQHRFSTCPPWALHIFQTGFGFFSFIWK